MDYQKQSIILIALSILIGSIFNLLSDDGIPWISEPIKIVNNSEDALDILAEPSIREVEIETAKALHGSGILFVDARAEEYLSDGFIPGAIASDDISILSDQIETMIGFDTGFVIYCSDDDCGSSEELSYQLYEQGFESIYLFKGGWKQWIENNLPAKYY